MSSFQLDLPVLVAHHGDHRGADTLTYRLRYLPTPGSFTPWDSQTPGLKLGCTSAGWAVTRGQSDSDRVTGPLVPRRRIGAELARLRGRSGKSLNDLSKATLISTSQLSRLENAQGTPRLRDVRDLIRYHEIGGTQLAGRLEQWVEEAQSPGWWTSYDEELLESRLARHGRLDAHLAYEVDATVERVYTLPFVPVLLQTPRYAAAVYRDMEGRSDSEIDKLIDVRLKRQEALEKREGLEPLELVAVTHESSLRQAVGSAEVLQEQLATLIERSMAPNVTLHVFPFTAKPVFTMTCMYAYFEYQDGDNAGQDADNAGQDVVHIETPAGFFTIDEPTDVAKYREAHKKLVTTSLSEDESRDRIRAIHDSLRDEK
jgi:transcriptional regulator with XRE-family HTH domain